MGVLDADALFDQSVIEAAEKVKKLTDINLVVGVPFYNETFTLPACCR